MSKPSSIKTVRFLLYIQLLYIVFKITNTFIYAEEIEAGRLLINIIIVTLPPVLAFILIQNRKYWLTVLVCFFGLMFNMGDPIGSMLSLGTMFFLFNRNSRNYLKNVSDRLDEEEPETVEAEATVEPDEAAAEPSSGKEALPEGEKREGEATAAVSAAKGPSKPKPSADPVIEIREAAPENAEVIHSLMMEAFEEFRKAVPPSSALNETAEGIREALESGKESAAILYEDNLPSAMIRYKLDGDAIYFFRLSVVPARRKRGLARMLVEWIEQKGRSKGMSRSTCMVRQTVHRNLVMYENMGYEVTGQELFVRPEGSVTSLKLEKYIGL